MSSKWIQSKNLSKWISILFLIFCMSYGKSISYESNIENLQLDKDSLKQINQNEKTSKMNTIHTFLTFQDGNAENAMNFYLELFKDSKVIDVKRWGAGGPVEEGKIMHASFQLNGSLFMCSDSPPIHEWGFTPAVSNFVNCESEVELERLYNALSENGKVMMPLNNYGFSKKFGFVEDRFSVSWQLNLE